MIPARFDGLVVHALADDDAATAWQHATGKDLAPRVEHGFAVEI
jgi:hypothetical protein